MVSLTSHSHFVVLSDRIDTLSPHTWASQGKVSCSTYTSLSAVAVAVACVAGGASANAVPSGRGVTLGGSLVVNLDSDMSRWDASIVQLSSSSLLRDLPLGITRVAGVSAVDIDLPEFVNGKKLDPKAYNDIVSWDHPVAGVRLTLGALGCLESHVAAWRRVVEVGKPMLVFEDDVTLLEGFDAGLANALAHLPSDFGMLYLANILGEVIEPNLKPFDVSSCVRFCSFGLALLSRRSFILLYVGCIVAHGGWPLGNIRVRRLPPRRCYPAGVCVSCVRPGAPRSLSLPLPSRLPCVIHSRTSSFAPHFLVSAAGRLDYHRRGARAPALGLHGSHLPALREQLLRPRLAHPDVVGPCAEDPPRVSLCGPGRQDCVG